VSASIANDWAISFALGAIVIVLFAWDRLNRPIKSHADKGYRRQRLLSLLVPAQMRNAHIFIRAYLFYTLFLLIVYTIGSLGITGLRLFVDPAAATQAANLQGAEWPLTMALVVVGLAPGLPPLARLEEKFRRLAHMLAGVPANLHGFADALMAVELDRDSLGGDLIGPRDAQRLAAVLAAAKAVLGEGTQFQSFANNTMKLYAARAWNQGGASWPSYQVRREFRLLEAEITPVVAAVIEDVEDLATGFRAAPVVEQEDHAENISGEIRAQYSRWRSLADRAEACVDDVCVLFALYAERSTERPVRDNPISRLLRDLIDHAQARRNDSDPRHDAVLLGVLSVAGFAFLAGYVGERLGYVYLIAGASSFSTALLYLINTTILYGPTSLLALNARYPLPPAVWVNPYRTRGVFPVRQFLALAFWAYLVSVLLLSLFFLMTLSWSHLANQAADDGAGFDVYCIAQQFLGVSFGDRVTTPDCAPLAIYWGPMIYALLGAWNAVNIALMADLVQARADTGRTLGQRVMLHAGGLGLICFFAAEFLGRWSPPDPKDGIIGPDIGIPLTAPQETVIFEMLAAFAIGLLFSLMIRGAFVRLRDGDIATAERVSPMLQGG
jgi:hypothetical protein